MEQVASSKQVKAIISEALEATEALEMHTLLTFQRKNQSYYRQLHYMYGEAIVTLSCSRDPLQK